MDPHDRPAQRPDGHVPWAHIHTPGSRSLGPRRALPSGRAALGGLLVSLAMVGTWWAASGDPEPGLRVVVASRTLAPGERLAPDDLAVVEAQLPPRVARATFRSAADLQGTVAVGPIEAGEMVQGGAVAPAVGGRDDRELALAVDLAGGVGGAVRTGDRVDVLVTYGEGEQAETRRVLVDVPVVAVGSVDGLGGASGSTVTVVVRGVDRVVAAAGAARAGTVTVVRSTGAGAGRAADRSGAGS